MCGRYSLKTDQKLLEKRFEISLPTGLAPRYNVAPTQSMPVITNTNATEAHFCKWGLVPHWGINDASGANLINVRSETILTKNTFKTLVHSQRCLILADGFYEWKKELKKRTPYRITLADDAPFAFAGIWDDWQYEDGTKLRTFGIITTEAEGEIKDLHDRMPVILTPEAEKIWLHTLLSEIEIKDIFQKHTLTEFYIFKSHRSVNSSSIDTVECLEPAPPIYPGESYSLFG